MNTILKNIDNDNEDDIYGTASQILKKGGLVAFPTETVYGLGGDALNPKAAADIYRAKGRPSDNPLIVHIADTADVYKLAEDVNATAVMLMEAFWPGPLTIIFKKKDIVPSGTTGGLDTVAIRMPSHPVAMKLIKDSGVYIAAPSANTSGRPSPTTAAHVVEDLDGAIDMIIDGGAVGIGIESTIVDVTGAVPTILRPGYITKKMLEEVVGHVEIDKAVEHPDINLKPKAPGMKYTHYAPKGSLTVVEGENDKVVARINEEVAKKKELGYRTGIMGTTGNIDSYKADVVINVGDRDKDSTVAAKLYAVLREFDEDAVEYIYSESFDNDDLGYAIMNRLLKAAGHKIIEV